MRLKFMPTWPRKNLTTRSFLAGVFFAAAAVACNSQASPAAPDGGVPVVVALGDSLTSGPGLRPQETYPSLLQKRISDAGRNYNVTNAGVSGDTSSQALARFDEALVPGTRILVLAIGINDGLRGVPIESVERNISTMIERAQSRGIRVLLCAMEAPPVRGFGYTLQFHQLFVGLAERHSVPLVPFFLAGIIGNDTLDLNETLHPNAAGHRIIADTIWPHLRPML
jgi:acyl-CoA thioesterase-1